MSGLPAPRSRRSFLQVGLCAGLGMTLGDLFRMQARADLKNYESKEGKAKSIIHIFLPGGIAHQESFDPKPYAPLEYRGPLGTVQTKLPGVVFSQNLARTAQIADKLAICRSMSHGEAAHERGTHNMFTGYRPSPALSYPSFGSVISHELGPRKNLPPYVCIPGVPNEFAGSGYLSSAFGPFAVGSDPADAGFQVKDLVLPPGISSQRFDKRKTLLQKVDSHFKNLEKSDVLDAMDSFYSRAYGLISSKEAREAFNMAAESDKTKDAYGRNAAGQRMLLSRRLVEAGVRMVSLTYGGWDHHDGIAGAINSQLPPFDQAYAALIQDLESRGLLDSTLVVLTSEFGRTPKINATGGRDHWPKVFSVVLAGGGIKKGFVYGASDATGSEPDDHPLSVEDFATTIYHQLGIVA
ncbi:MAG: DUF1501 domain-containing protein, partial [Verrucomicrobia bacterium]|nr:DUF1501 domain-containing protein [Verrucomicrobiota bacterium]